jgi:hypothetical protein
MMRFPILFLLAGLVPSVGLAQYVASPQAGVPYPALSAPTVVTLTGIASTPASDVGRAMVTLPFAFPFFDRSYTSVMVNANGFLAFDAVADPMATFDTNTVLGTTTAPNAIIAPFWDDLDGDNPGSVVQRQAVTGPFGQGVAVEWKNWNRKATAHDLTFQVRLWENGMMEFFYGAMSGSGGVLSATIGIEGPGGVGNIYGLSSCPTNQCTLQSFDPGQTGNRVSYIRFGPPVGVDLQGSSLRVDGITESGGVLTVTTRLSMRNFGTNDSTAFSYRLRLAQSTVPSPTDISLTPVRQGPFTLTALQSTTHTAVSTVPRPASGSYYIVAELDDQSQIAETLESNNLVATSVPLASGVDLVAEDVTGPPLGGPNEPVALVARLSNQGFEAAGAVTIRVVASLDDLLDAQDPVIGQTVTPIAGGQNAVVNIAGVVPGLVRSGEYNLLLDVDPQNTVVERTETNNRAVGSKLQVLQADLILENFRVTQSQTPFDPATAAYFGQPIRFEVTVRNIGGSTVADGGVEFYLSDNETLSGTTDPRVTQVTGLNLPPGSSQSVSVIGTVPSRSRAGMLLNRGAYFFFGAAFAPGVREADPGNNFARSAAMVVGPPAANLRATQVQGPLRVGAGEVLAVSRAIVNDGAVLAADVKLRFYLSANTIITTEDTLLPIQSSMGERDETAYTLAPGQSQAATQLVRIPPTAPTGLLYIGVLLDPNNEVPETDENDNGLASSLTTVVPQGLVLDTSTPMPNGVIGQPYQAQLAAVSTRDVTFAAATPGEVPAGLTISPTGQVTGTPTASGAYGVTIELRAGTRRALGLVVIRVSSSTASLALATTSLPAPSRGLPYDTQLGAFGGQGPYAYRVDTGFLPAGLVLSASGRVTGTPVAALGTTTAFALRVTDSVGNSDARAFSLTVVDSSPVVLSPPSLPNGSVGLQYLQTLGLSNSSLAAVSKPVRWRVLSGSLPDGVALEASNTENVALSGTPQRPGLYRFRVEATDAQGRTDSVNYVVVVSVAGVSVTGAVPPRLLRGETVNAQLGVMPAITGTRYFLKDGLLPRGVMLDEATGLVSGTVADDAPFGRYTATVAIGTGPEAIFAVKSLGTMVAESANDPRPPGSGCAAAPEFGMVALIVFLRLRRRRDVQSRL